MRTLAFWMTSSWKDASNALTRLVALAGESNGGQVKVQCDENDDGGM